jgi:hypothetical protein
VTSAHEILASWESFYVILGSSAAALTGLQFVVMALIADLPGLRSEDSINAFGTPTVVHFCQCSFVAAVLSAPWHSMTPVFWLLLSAGIAGVFYTLIALRRARRQTSYRPVAEDWLWYTILPFVAYFAIICASLWLRRDPVAALFPVGASVLTLIFAGIHNAWDSVAYVTLLARPNQREQ